MNISNINCATNNNTINFKSGLNKTIVKNCVNTKASDVETLFKKSNIESDFRQSNTVAYLVKNSVNILEILKKKTGAKLFNYSVPGIFAYTLGDLTFDFSGKNFCIPETRKVLKDRDSFKTGSLFFESCESIEHLDSYTEKGFKNNIRSSSHYLSTIIHEFMHNVYLNYIYMKYGYEGSCAYTKQKYYSKEKQNNTYDILRDLQTRSFTDRENQIIENTIGKYATGKLNQYHEVFAETFTKLICDSLSKKGVPEKNPIDLLKHLNPEFLIILNKVFV